MEIKEVGDRYNVGRLDGERWGVKLRRIDPRRRVANQLVHHGGFLGHGAREGSVPPHGAPSSAALDPLVVVTPIVKGATTGA